jgi:hypothetical protein
MGRPTVVMVTGLIAGSVASSALLAYGDHRPERNGVVLGGLIVMVGLGLLLSKGPLRQYEEALRLDQSNQHRLTRIMTGVAVVVGIACSWGEQLVLGSSAGFLPTFLWLMVWFLALICAWLLGRAMVLKTQR